VGAQPVQDREHAVRLVLTSGPLLHQEGIEVVDVQLGPGRDLDPGHRLGADGLLPTQIGDEVPLAVARHGFLAGRLGDGALPGSVWPKHPKHRRGSARIEPFAIRTGPPGCPVAAAGYRRGGGTTGRGVGSGGT